jgi:hypothetical protein
VLADRAIPLTWVIVTEDFESGTLDAWTAVSESDLSLAPAGGHNGSTGLSVAVGQHESYLRRTDVARAEEGYLTFWFNPNGVGILDRGTSWIPGQSIRIGNVKGSEWWRILVALRIHSPGDQGYKAYLEWHADDDDTRYDLESGEFDLVDGWQKITLGFRVDDWVAVWLNDVLVRQVSGVAHKEAFGEIMEIGKTNSNSSITTTGALRYDDVAFQVPRVDDLWVDAVNGDDGDNGLTLTTAFRTIQKAADLAGPGTTVHILAGLYRETVWPAMSGSAVEPALYLAENGPSPVIIRGSEPSQSLTWTRLVADPIGLMPGVDPINIYYADLSAWELEGPPRFVVELDGNGEVIGRLPLAREPDWQVSTEWKHHEFWWAADGGSDVAGCDPATDSDPNCDFSWRSTTQLTDRSDDAGPDGIESGNLMTLGDLTGATVVAIDTKQGHYVYRRAIVAHEISAGRITVDEICEHDSGSGDPGLGWGSKYYVENHPALLDTPGEWWYDPDSGFLYLWPLEHRDPATLNIEISRRDNGFILKNRSHIILDGLIIEFLTGSAVYQANNSTEKSYNNSVRNAVLRYSNHGIRLGQAADGTADRVTDGFTLEHSEIAHMDTYAIYMNYWWGSGSPTDSFTHAGIANTVIQDNELHHLGFRADRDSAVGALFPRADRLRFERNHVHHVAHNGVQFSKSVIHSDDEYGFAPDEIKTGAILIKDNVFEKACQLTTDCGALKFWGDPPDTHVFRDVLIAGNVFRNTIGWTYISEKRGLWWHGGTGSDVQGMGGKGLSMDMASGIHAYRNVAYNNAYAGFMIGGVWRDGDVVYYNNVAANSLYGFRFGGLGFDTHGSVNTQVVNNIIVNNEGYGILRSDADGIYHNMTFDHNLYYNNGWREQQVGGLYRPGAMAIFRGADPNEYYQTLADIHANTPWESHGVGGDPSFWDYDPDDHDLHDGSWSDFHITAASVNTVDRGTAGLPASLTRLLAAFGVDDVRFGSAFDIGRYEAAGVLATPATRFIQPGTAAQFTLRIYPPSFPDPLTLSVSSASPDLILDLGSTFLSPGETVTLTVTHTHDAGPVFLPGLWYTITVAATHGGGTQHTDIRLLVGGARLYLPIIVKPSPYQRSGG